MSPISGRGDEVPTHCMNDISEPIPGKFSSGLVGSLLVKIMCENLSRWGHTSRKRVRQRAAPGAWNHFNKRRSMFVCDKLPDSTTIDPGFKLRWKHTIEMSALYKI